MNPVIIRNIKIGEGIPKICVPVAEISKEDIIAAAKTIQDVPADLVEWCADWFEDVYSFEKVKAVLKELREAIGDIPLLFTFRTAKEGGEKAIEDAVYAKLNKNAAGTGFVDLVDVEVF